MWGKWVSVASGTGDVCWHRLWVHGEGNRKKGVSKCYRWTRLCVRAWDGRGNRRLRELGLGWVRGTLAVHVGVAEGWCSDCVGWGYPLWKTHSGTQGWAMVLKLFSISPARKLIWWISPFGFVWRVRLEVSTCAPRENIPLPDGRHKKCGVHETHNHKSCIFTDWFLPASEFATAFYHV